MAREIAGATEKGAGGARTTRGRLGDERAALRLAAALLLVIGCGAGSADESSGVASAATS